MKAKVKDRIQGSYYYSQKCRFCGELITGSDEKSRKGARVDEWRRMVQHGKDHHPEKGGERK